MSTSIGSKQRVGYMLAQDSVKIHELSAARAQVAYNQAMASCSWEQAWACFHTMRRAGVQPNTRSYNAVSTLPQS